MLYTSNTMRKNFENGVQVLFIGTWKSNKYGTYCTNYGEKPSLM